MVNSVDVVSNGRKTKGARGDPPVKIYDLVTSGVVTLSGAITTSRFQPSQGITLNQRVGDVAYMKKAWMNYEVTVGTAIDGGIVRVIVLQWHPNTSITGPPTVNDILQTSTVFSLYDWNFSDQFRILYDRVHFLTGTGSSNTTGSNQGYFGPLRLNQAVSCAEFGLGIITGSQQIFVLFITDVAVAPFPEFVLQTRVSFSEE
jgi:hypothetical protein